MGEPKTFAVVGGGIAGVSCMLELIENAERDDEINFVFVCGKSGFIKTVDNYERLGVYLERFDVKNQVPNQDFFKSKKIKIFMEDVEFWQPHNNTIRLTNSQTIQYERLCIATGARPKTLSSQSMDTVIQIRDVDTIENLQIRLARARRIVIVGTGGIAMELAYELKNMEIYWASKSAYVGTPFFDATIALGLEERFGRGREEGELKREVVLDRYAVETSQEVVYGAIRKSTLGCSLGPSWLAKLEQPVKEEQKRTLTILRCVQVVNYFTAPPTGNDEEGWGTYVRFDNGQVVGCDFVIEALGVVPNTEKWKEWAPDLKLAEDQAIAVNENMRTSIENVYACGDVCTIQRKEVSRTWKQMRLWTQARVMGLFTARCMLDSELELDSWFDMFSHVTTFAGQKIVLLGNFLSETQDVEHVFTENSMTRVALENNRIVGAILVGQTGLDEVFETLILNSFDVSDLPRPIVNQQIDLADYFD